MKLSSLLFAVLLECLAVNSRAAEISVGAEVAPLVAWADQCVLLIYCRQEDQGGHSNGYGFHVGIRLPHDDIALTGLEIGHDKLGSISGSTIYSLSPGCIILCPGATASWKHETTITHVAVAGQLPSDKSMDKGAVFSKIGLYSSSTDTRGNFGTGGGAYSRKVFGAGLFLGAGYIMPLTRHLSARAAADIFFNVKISDPIKSGGAISETLFKFALGVDYTF